MSRHRKWLSGAILLGIAGYTAAAADSRAVLVESSLKDLSRQNAASTPSIRETPLRADCPECGDRVHLPEPSQPGLSIGAEINSSLHRLRRENVIQQTDDERRVLVEQALETQQDPG